MFIKVSFFNANNSDRYTMRKTLWRQLFKEAFPNTEIQRRIEEEAFSSIRLLELFY